MIFCVVLAVDKRGLDVGTATFWRQYCVRDLEPHNRWGPSRAMHGLSQVTASSSEATS